MTAGHWLSGLVRASEDTQRNFEIMLANNQNDARVSGMNSVLIKSKTETEYSTIVEAVCGTIEALVTFPKTGGVRVYVPGAHRLVNGRSFSDMASAIAAYKKAEVRAILWAVS